jgi:hypothetical protein
MMALTFGVLLRVVGASPCGVANGFAGVFVEGLAQEGGAGIASLYPGLIA